VKFLEETVVRPDGFHPKEDGKGFELGLDDELRSLLDFGGESCRAYTERYPGFPTT